jgi:hypothetical protein
LAFEDGMAAIDKALDRIGRWMAARAVELDTEPLENTPQLKRLEAVLQPCDILLVDGGGTKVASIIKYMTQSTWSHAALYVGKSLEGHHSGKQNGVLVESELGKGVIVSPLARYAGYPVRICRPVGLLDADKLKIIAFCARHIGDQYDTRNILDLLRWLLPAPPIPVKWRRRMLSLGSGEPTRVICSGLIAQAFQNVKFPILPSVKRVMADGGEDAAREILHIRHHSLFTPRDFDVSPYFAIIKPTLEHGFDYRGLAWNERDIDYTLRPRQIA